MDRFDAYLESCGWHYDNGFSYDGRAWDAYARNHQYDIWLFVRAPEEAAIVKNPHDSNRSELWRGPISSMQDLVEFAARADRFHAEARAGLANIRRQAEQ